MTASTELQAGPEMDRRIAELVFGCNVGIKGDLSGDADAWSYICSCPYGEHEDATLHRRQLWRYSTDIAAAWLVVEKMNMPFCMTRFSEPISPGVYYDASFMAGDGWIRCIAETAPEAICRAALSALDQS